MILARTGTMAAISANCVINLPGTLLCLNRYSFDGIWMTNDCNEYMFRENVVIGMSVIDAEAVCVIFFMTTTMNAAKASVVVIACLLYTSPSPRDGLLSRMPSSA